MPVKGEPPWLASSAADHDGLLDFSREVLGIAVGTSLASSRVIGVLEQIPTWRQLAMSIRIDIRSEFTGETMGEWCQEQAIHLTTYRFDLWDKVRDIAWDWQIEYNEERSHDSLNNLTAVEYRPR